MYYCKKMNEYIPLDGNVNKQVWEQAVRIELFETATGNAPKQKTEVKALWNEEFLYIAFKCEDNYINATMTGYNDHLYEEEVVEVFIDDNNDLKTYAEFEVNPLNAVLHYQMLNNLEGEVYPFEKLGKSVESAVQVVDGGWNVELAIPFLEFVTAQNNPPKHSDVWGINFFRIDRPQDGNDEYSAWGPTQIVNFHTPANFKQICFVER